ncbi:CFI-box-CTERM domain-containing protein [Alteromonas macleodii]|uniref:CFI-box-CTERM domain-containing protein n=1 Tax=Alteromonas macleodii TaxID=28108 RepID=UPI002076988C|nr:CFI-box-CTERM domain-containing protein [Alteromonas macleodii]USI27903.1 hypothetical protein NFG60_19700 [Alteromonas macleodii]
MSYPTLEQYNEVFQYPQLALSDPQLKVGKIKTTSMGMPLALCGGFALTYTLNVGTEKYAIRCFHKQSLDLEARYKAIALKLKSLNSKYFLDFDFQPQGIKVLSNHYPLVKMAWANGETLGEFLEKHHKNPTAIKNLQTSLKDLSVYLESKNIAHGDISPDNLMVSNNGNSIQLIDYDGMYVPAFKGKKSTELGNRNFQHLKRTALEFNDKLDRFSFILLYIACEILIVDASFWSKTNSEATAVIFRANDYSAPENSNVFKELAHYPNLSHLVNGFAAISKSSFSQIPSLNDFINSKNIPKWTPSKTQITPNRYLATYPVVNAKDYSIGLNRVGDIIELVGQIEDIAENTTRYGKPYVFVNFGNWKGNIIKLNIWSEGLATLTNKPNKAWVGKWISVTGLMEPPYVNRKLKYSHLSISITKNNQISFISQSEANYRLSGSTSRSVVSRSSQSSNQDILSGLKNNSSKISQPSIKVTNTNQFAKRQTPLTNNQAILNKINSSRAVNNAPAKSNYTPYSYQNRQSSYKSGNSSSNSNKNCFIATAIYGENAAETNSLRRWRDNFLLKRVWGRLFVRIYYLVSPKIVGILESSPILKRRTKMLIDKIVKRINK